MLSCVELGSAEIFLNISGDASMYIVEWNVHQESVRRLVHTPCYGVTEQLYVGVRFPGSG